jgi:A/G-specific adenine glycosylase
MLRSKSFSKKLLQWYREEDRPMPWKNESNPYLIWISEIILQQTRVEQGWSYYLKFREAFPNVKSLAVAEEDQVLRLWQGLGYYSRARNLHFAAKQIIDKHDGVFPTTYKDLISLKGVGEYTASAILSFAYQQPYAVVDGNVIRLLSRLYGIDEYPSSSIGKTLFRQRATELLDMSNPGKYNQAIMDFGATVCKPAPTCSQCPFQKQCFANLYGLQKNLPKKGSKKSKKSRYFDFYFIEDSSGKIAVRKRNGNDIWRGLYELPYLEHDKDPHEDTPLYSLAKEDNILYERRRQELSHQKIHARFIYTNPQKHELSDLTKNSEWKERNEIRELAFPKIIVGYLTEKGILEY